MPSSLWLLPILGLMSCSTPGPVPSDRAARNLREVTLDEAARAQVDVDTQAALIALRADREDEAFKLANAVLKRDPRAARARAILGRVLLTRALREVPPELLAMEEVEGELLLARRLDPSDSEVLLFYSQFLEADGHISLAVEVLGELLAGEPEHIGGLRGASRLQFELGKERAARPLLERLVALDSQDSDALYRLAHCRLELAESLARGDVTATDPPATDGLATDLSTTDEMARALFQQAAADFQAYQLLVSDEILGHLGEVRALLRAAELIEGEQPQQALEEFEAVIDLLNRAIARDPNSPVPSHARGAVLVHLGRLAEARTVFEGALRLDPAYLPTLLDLARLLDTLGEKELAKNLCRRALALPVTPTERRQLESYLGGGLPASSQAPMME